MPEALPPVTVVVVAYGPSGDLERCLAALGGELPVLVVDNGSSEAARAVVAGAGATCVDPGRNLGFAAGVNLALSRIDLARSDVLLLNPDAVVSPADVRRLQEALHSAPDVACVAPAQHHPDTAAPVAVCWPFATPGRAWAEALGLARGDTQWDFVIASVLVVRGEALRAVGGFDERFFLYAEEADWERRATSAGWRVRYQPDVSALHAGGATDSDAAGHQLRFHAAVERYVRKWHGAAGWRSYQAATVLTALRRAALSGREARRRSLALARLYAGGPASAARRAGAVPEREPRVPRFD